MKIIVFIDQIVNTQVKLQGVDYFDSSKVNEDDLVINPNSKNAIEGALKLQDSIGAEVTAVCVKGLKPNTRYRIVFKKPGYVDREIEVNLKKDMNLGEVILDPVS